MANIPGTNIAAMVVPFDTADIYATHNDKYGRGGFRVCDTLVERDAITELRRKAGMWVKVLETNKVYELGVGLTNADWIEVTFGSGGGTTCVINPNPDGIHVEVFAGQTITLDSIPLTARASNKWFINMYEPDMMRCRNSEVTSHHDFTDVTFNEVSVLGESLPANVDVILSGGYMNLVFTNSGPNTIVVDAMRITGCGSNTIVNSDAGQITVGENLIQSRFRSSKWFLTISDSVSFLTKSSEITAMQDPQGNIRFTQYGLFGDVMPVSVDFVPNSGNISLIINNGSANNVTVEIMRMATIFKNS